MKIKEIMVLQDKMPVLDLEATIEKVYPQKSGTGEYGDWSIQGVTLTDGQDSIHANLKSCPDVSNMAGNRVLISCVESKQWGLTGAKMGTYNNKRQLEITKSAVFKTTGNSPTTRTNAPETPKTVEKVSQQPTQAKNNRPFALSYAKDLAVAYINMGKEVKTDEIIENAVEFDDWMNNIVEFENTPNKE